MEKMLKQSFEFKPVSRRYVRSLNGDGYDVEVTVDHLPHSEGPGVIRSIVSLPRELNLCDLGQLIELLKTVKDRGAQLEDEFRRIFNLTDVRSTQDYVAMKIGEETPPSS